MSMTALSHRSEGKQRARDDDDPLAVLDENGSAEPLDEHEQEEVIKSIRQANEKSNYIYRGCMLVLMGLVGVLYLTPIPDYIMGTHPETHLTLHFGPSHLEATTDDLYKFPAMPIYLFFLALQGTILFAAFYETLDRMGHVRSKGTAFPHQPHLFGTAPNFLAPILSDIRWHPSQVGARSDQPEYYAPPVTATMPPRVLYLCMLTLTSLPLPLMTFGAGNFVNAAWWAVTSFVLIFVVSIEFMINKFDKETLGLNGLRYGYKGA